MLRARLFSVLAMLLGLASFSCLAQDFKTYPGAKLDENASRVASSTVPGMQSQVYTTADSFDKVYAFYKGLYKEHTLRRPARRPASTPEVRIAFFLLDGAKDLPSSGYWMKVQRPWMSGADGKDVRDVTVIQTVRGHGEPRNRRQ